MIGDFIFDPAIHKTIWLFWVLAAVAVPWAGRLLRFQASTLRVMEAAFLLHAAALLLMVAWPGVIDVLENMQASPLGALAIIYYRQDFLSLFRTK